MSIRPCRHARKSYLSRYVFRLSDSPAACYGFSKVPFSNAPDDKTGTETEQESTGFKKKIVILCPEKEF